ncbi:MAG: zinc-binding dehydrogenase [Pseudomonadales bacterium]|nr:zinc-binding dehydrogenase [Pseudomonadales bacterium]
MTSMRAARLYAAGQPLIIEEIPVPIPQPDEVLVQVEACGLCGTDIHLAVDGDIPVQRTPITLGHEAAGIVVGIGGGVTQFSVGDRVALFPSATCGRCRFCLLGRESLCEKARVYGMACDGSLAQFVVAPAWSLIPVPAGFPLELAAIITDGVATPFHALRSRGQLQAGETVAVVGCGGLGSHAILLARLMGAAHIVAVDSQEHARQRAFRLGADTVIDPATEPMTGKAVRRELGRGVDLALEFVGRPETVDTALATLDTGGRAVIVGVGPGRPRLPPMLNFVGREHSLLGSFGMDKRDIADLIQLVAGGRLSLESSISGRYALAQVNEALARLAGGSTDVVRLVVLPGE